MKKKLLFIQLPIPRLKLACEDHNVPVAAYSLQAYLSTQPISRHLDIHILDPSLQNYGADETILHGILAIAPDIIGFSLFCWNLERSLALAKWIKATYPPNQRPLILAGGPEVTPDNSLLHQSAIDLYTYGEGEYTLKAILDSWLAERQIPHHIPGTMSLGPTGFLVNPPQSHAIDLNQTRSPYLQGLVPRTCWREMFVETMRGCPYSCRFCYYNKNCGEIRFLDQKMVLELLHYAREQDYDRMFLLDPSFNIRPDLEALLKDMANINADRQVKIATELRADKIDDHLAQLLAEAGFYEVELGLQSIHADTIRKCGRTQCLDSVLQGTHAMLDRGIETKVDLLVGLPGDSLEKFKESARLVRREGLDGYLQVFCLSLLPGTFFRKHADELKLKFFPFPPYYIRSSPDWSPEDIREAFSWAEDYFGITFEPDTDKALTLDPVELSVFSDDDSVQRDPLQQVIYIDPSQLCRIPASTTYITKWVIGPIRSQGDLISHLKPIQRYTSRNPYGVYQVYLELCREIPLDALIEFCTAFKSVRTQFIDRDLSVLSIHEAPIFHYQMGAIIRDKDIECFSAAYLQMVERHFPFEFVNSGKWERYMIGKTQSSRLRYETRTELFFNNRNFLLTFCCFVFMACMSEEKRQYIRHPSDIPIIYEPVNEEELQQKECLRNISLGGLSFRTDHRLEARTLLEITIDLVRPVFKGKAVIVWCWQHEEHYDVGVQFIDKNARARARIVEQVCHIEQYKLDVLKTEGRELSGEDAAIEWIQKHADDFPRL